MAESQAELADAVLAGDRRSLARAITLVESTRPEDVDAAAELLEALLPATGGAIRVGISGTPGVGKSTFIEEVGSRLLDSGDGQRVAVLAVDPSSARSGGSILGDKTRMGRLARNDDAFIRPSPAGGSLGGVARRTREAMLVCEAAGFDVVLVETVGVGQSEVAVAGMVDTFVLLLAPAGGDELQGIKRGVMELADIVAVNKADGDLVDAARHAAADYRHALHLIRPRWPSWQSEVLLCSATTGDGLDEVWDAVGRHRAALEASGDLELLRQGQRVEWLWSDVQDRLVSAARGLPSADDLTAAVKAGDVEPGAASQSIVNELLNGNH